LAQFLLSKYIQNRPVINLQEQNKHLYARAGFGISPANYAAPRPIEEVVNSLFPDCVSDIELITADEWAENSPRHYKETKDSLQEKKMNAFNKKTTQLVLLWMQNMVDTQYPLLEKMSLFWHGHFATHVENAYYEQLMLNTIRRNALGNFGDMLKAVSKSQAMLIYLNTIMNYQSRPNENFAREVMELFTLGRGHYTETDIKQAARAFTGWQINNAGEVVFSQESFDGGEKDVLGEKGNFDCDKLLDILLQKKQTALFVTQKIYKFFVCDDLNNEDNEHIEKLADHFYNSNYDIGSLVKQIFTADWFYKDIYLATKIKSPVELLVSYQRLVPFTLQNPYSWVTLQTSLGQLLFNPPNVAGWPGGKYWINSSSIVIRMRLAEAFYASKELSFNLDNSSNKPGSANKKTAQQDRSHTFTVGKVASVDWDSFLTFWKNYKRENIAGEMAGLLLPFPISKERISSVESLADKTSDENYIKSVAILLMELPEYQLC
jgi:uncharacterized protein (DUF1800 family)